MIPSNKPIRSNSRRFQVCVLACMMIVLPLGVVSAQDYEAVTKRLRAAVAAGELTGGQARTMLASLKKADSPKKQVARSGKKNDRKKADHGATWQRLLAMVKAGKLTEKQAHAKMSAIKKEVASKTMTRGKAPARRQARIKKAQAPAQKSNRYEAYLTKVKKELGAAVATGRISREDAGKRFKAAQEAMKKRMAAAPRQARAKKVQAAEKQPDWAQTYLTKVKKELGAAVETGRISRKDAGKRFKVAQEGVAKRMAGASRQAQAKKAQDPDPASARTRAYLMQVRTELGAAVAAGKISREDAGKKYKAAEEGIKKRMEMGQRREKTGNDGRPLRGRRDQRNRNDDTVGKRRKAGVKAGKIPEKDAEAKWIEIKSKAVHKDVD